MLFPYKPEPYLNLELTLYQMWISITFLEKDTTDKALESLADNFYSGLKGFQTKSRV